MVLPPPDDFENVEVKALVDVDVHGPVVLLLGKEQPFDEFG